MSNIISGNLGYKGETGLSAYELAVQNGYQGTVNDWLRSLGTSSMFSQYKTTDTGDGTTTKFDLSEEYVDGGFVDVYVDGLHVLASEYEIIEVEGDTTTYQVEFDTAPANGKTVELVTTLISTQNLPISDTISSISTDDTASSSKAVYDYIETVKSTIKSISTIVDTIYPVGSIYMSVNSASPETLFGGTWEKIEDKFLLASSDTYTLGATGGETTHTLTTSEIPSHNHKHNPSDSTAVGATFKDGTGNRNYRIGSNNSGQYVFSASNTNSLEFATTSTARTGGGDAHNNMPPYLAVNIWKRTA